MLDIRTLQRSGPLPLVFLRGVGLPDALIDYLPALLGSAIEFYSCALSPTAMAAKSSRAGCTMSCKGGAFGAGSMNTNCCPVTTSMKVVDRGIRLWDKVLLCASAASLRSWWVDGEINRAFQKEAQLMKERGKKELALIPLNLDGYLLQWESCKATEVRARLAADFRGWETSNTVFETQLEQLVRALRTDAGGREAPPSCAPVGAFRP